MDVKWQPQIFAGHHRTFGVPAGKADTPRAVPLHQMLWLSRSPHGKIPGVTFVRGDFQAGPFFQVVNFAPGELPITGPTGYGEIDIALVSISIASLDQLLGQLDLFRDMAAGSGGNVRADHI